MENTTPTPSMDVHTSPPSAATKPKRSNFAGIFLILLGVLFLIQEIFPFWPFERLWPFILIAVGVWLVYRRQEK